MKQNVIISYDPGNEQTGWVVALENNSKLIYKNKDLNTIYSLELQEINMVQSLKICL